MLPVQVGCPDDEIPEGLDGRPGALSCLFGNVGTFEAQNPRHFRLVV
jgi:hypothetical protein